MSVELNQNPSIAAETGRDVSLCLFGAAPSSANLGVGALCLSTLGGLAERLPGAPVTVFDFGRGMRRATLDVGEGGREYALMGSTLTKRVYRSESVWATRLGVRMGGLGNPGARALLGASAVLDITGGDSFTDLYGAERLFGSLVRKRMALEAGAGLILLPQTYGPFSSARAWREASEVTRRAMGAWARDERSYETLKEMLGETFDPARHRCGVDVAFGLTPRRPRTAEADGVDRWVEGAGEEGVAGLNVSGLIWNDPGSARARYGFVADYRELVMSLLRRLIGAGARVMLVPHVIEAEGHVESDPGACAEVVGELRASERERVFVARGMRTAREAKWAVSRCGWFCGTRMHATIASLSTGVPTSAVAYSGKTAGVFETCGQGAWVADPRELGTGEVVERVWAGYEAREEARRSLGEHLPGVRDRAREQMDVIASWCVEAARERTERSQG